MIDVVEQISSFLYISEDRHAEQIQPMLRHKTTGAFLVSIHLSSRTIVCAYETPALSADASTIGTVLLFPDLLY